MPAVPAIMIDDVENINRSSDLRHVMFDLVCDGETRHIALPVDAAAKLWVGLADVFRRDGRSLQERRNLAEGDHPDVVPLLDGREVSCEAPDTRSEPFHLAIRLDGGLVLNVALDRSLTENLERQCHNSLSSHESLENPKPN